MTSTISYRTALSAKCFVLCITRSEHHGWNTSYIPVITMLNTFFRGKWSSVWWQCTVFRFRYCQQIILNRPTSTLM